MATSFAFILNRVSVPVRRCLRPAVLVFFLLVPTLALAGDEPEISQAVTSSYLYHLGTFTGTIPFEWVPIIIDEARQEVYVLNSGEHSVYIFNDSGLQVYQFDINDRLGNVGGLALLENGDILLLCYPPSGSEATLFRCDYRGDVQEEIAFTGLPPALGRFRPDRMVLRKGRLYLAQMGDLRVAVFDLQGKYLEHFDLAKLLGLRREDGPVNADLGGFDVDQDGTMFFTVPSMFHGYRLRPGHELEEFGRSGGAPGRFNVVGGIAAGPEGLIFTADTLKSAILVFDQNFNFLFEFGYRGSHPDSMVGPRNIAVSQSGKLYVTQLAKQGIKVFRFTVAPLTPPEPVEHVKPVAPVEPAEGGK